MTGVQTCALPISEGAAILAQSLPSSEEAIVGKDKISPYPQGLEVFITTKHKTFIQLANADGSYRMEKIIDSQEVLPLEVNRKFRTLTDNQKLVEVKLFSDDENGGYEKLASGFFTISENLPSLSDLNFSFHLDEDETMSAKVKIVKTGKEIDIRLGRGRNDSRCLSELSHKIEDILTNGQISPAKKGDFVNDVQSVVDSINKENLTPDSSKWDEFEQDIRRAYTRALIGEKQVNNMGQIFATIILQNFNKFIRPNDKKQLEEIGRAHV